MTAHIHTDSRGCLYGDTESIRLAGKYTGIRHTGFGNFACNPIEGVACEVRWERIDGTDEGDALEEEGFEGRPHEIRVTPRQYVPDVEAWLVSIGCVRVPLIWQGP